MKRYKDKYYPNEHETENIFLNLSDKIMIEYLKKGYVRVYEFGDTPTPKTKIAKVVNGIKSNVVMINNNAYTIPKLRCFNKIKQLKSA